MSLMRYLTPFEALVNLHYDELTICVVVSILGVPDVEGEVGGGKSALAAHTLQILLQVFHRVLIDCLQWHMLNTNIWVT